MGFQVEEVGERGEWVVREGGGFSSLLQINEGGQRPYAGGRGALQKLNIQV